MAAHVLGFNQFVCLINLIELRIPVDFTNFSTGPNSTVSWNLTPINMHGLGQDLLQNIYWAAALVDICKLRSILDHYYKQWYSIWKLSNNLNKSFLCPKQRLFLQLQSEFLYMSVSTMEKDSHVASKRKFALVLTFNVKV